MNPRYYDEHRPRHRRSLEYYRRTLAIGAVPLALSIWLAVTQFPLIGPGLYANAGLSLAGLLLLWSVRAMQREPPRSVWGRGIMNHIDALYPALLVSLQGWFVMLSALLIWFTVTELGFPANAFHHGLLVGILLLSPVRRVLRGTEPPHPSPRRELLMEGLGNLNAILITLFVTAIMTTSNLPPGVPLTGEIPPLLLFTWMGAVLVVLTCVILFLDHIVRKMPPTIREEQKDTLD
ncbi:MAG TPA: hypothetical protein PKE12_05150 [Kiritimatiellia bacterium]|nr:hypothetical protein [Kiritimatiellia bacterium]